MRRHRHFSKELPTVISRTKINETVRQHVEQVIHNIEDAKHELYPDGFANGISGFAEWICFFSSQARFQHPNETRNDRKTRYNTCLHRNSQAVQKVESIGQLDELVCELHSKGKTSGIIVDFQSLQMLRNVGFGTILDSSLAKNETHESSLLQSPPRGSSPSHNKSLVQDTSEEL